MTYRDETPEDTNWDVLVIGAGPAGSLAAREIANGGARVLLVERRAFPRWKVCGACLNGRGLAVLHDVGLGDLTTKLGAVPLKTFDLRHRGRSVRLNLPAGVAISRSSLDSALMDEARNAGVSVIDETVATVLPAESDRRRVRLTRQGHSTITSAQVVIVAAGLGQHCVEDTPELNAQPVAGSRMGAGCVIDDPIDGYEPGTLGMAVGRHGYVGMVRVEDGRLNVAAAFERDWLRSMGTPGTAAASILKEAGFPGLSAIENATWQGTVGLTRRTRVAGSHRLLLVGDAIGYVEPFTGEGMAWGLAAGRAVAPLALKGVGRWESSFPNEWTLLHNQINGTRQRVCRVVAGILRRPLLSRLAFSMLLRSPSLARPFLSHLNHASLTRSNRFDSLTTTGIE